MAPEKAVRASGPECQRRRARGRRRSAGAGCQDQ